MISHNQMPRVRGLGPGEKRRRELETVGDVLARHQVVSGEFLVAGAGDSAIDVHFPVWFTEKPLLSFGGEVANNTVVQAGSFPTISVVVGRWELKTPDAAETRLGERIFYVGATLLVVTSASLFVHWHVEGTAITNPTSGMVGATTEVVI